MSEKKINLEVGPDGWDKEAVYDAELFPLISKIIEICKREELPLLVSVNYRKSDDTGDGESMLCTTHLAGPKGEVNERFSDVKTLRARSRTLAVTITKGASHE